MRQVAILDESTQSGGVGATVSAAISEQCFDLLDAPVQRLCMDDAPVPHRRASAVPPARASSVARAAQNA